MKKYSMFLMILLVILLSGCDVQEYSAAVDPTDNAEILFTVPKGATTKRIGALLMESELIKADWAFKMLVQEKEVDGKLQAGDYMLSKAMSSEEIITKLAKGEVYIETFKFTIPEGYEFSMIVDRLEKEGLIDRDVFMDLAENYEFDYRFIEPDRTYKFRLEGFLYPATYELRAGSDELAILKAMLDQFDKIYTDEFYKRTLDLGLSINEAITLASIVERECKVEEELAIIASVFHNRLNIGQKLESCATIQYELQERKDKILFADLEIDSPFNTYMYTGLPPAPIASPDKEAINAVLYPADTDYLYFVVSGDNDGKHSFSTTYNQHLKAKAEAEQKLGQ
ncbi:MULTISPECIES: endolytic transglycosylase MltG [unclassified Fusibacter]|uniref:endolytic transglycosylase MltG n=1 Tax=unclassified Fusibacter TaxID=2624464 RepID=UPI0010110A58|nr:MULTISPECIES: endolytic transglycosylase MltG [unclassified Fusibacter]MCK8058912.1 endolytic transglycosylase MltG [Fusibacter sp. A2]NPE21987.1 endolytic transglycosylase MltG [Fusibacter sp. A1]RXV61554.1 endolytic transglycosylase MltG [Fusibacter sp. A1]